MKRIDFQLLYYPSYFHIKVNILEISLLHSKLSQFMPVHPYINTIGWVAKK